MTLTNKQQRFVDEYLIDLNSTQAAIRAGYSAKNADKIGPELLGNTRVSEAIQAAMKERSDRVKMTQDDVLKELSIIAKTDMRDYAASDGKGRIIIKAFDAMPPSATKAIKKIKQTVTILSESVDEDTGATETVLKVQTELELHDKIRANELVGKHLGMFQEKKPPEGGGSNPDDDPLVDAIGDSAASDWSDDTNSSDGGTDGQSSSIQQKAAPSNELVAPEQPSLGF